MIALTILALAPAVMDLSAVVRSYTLALLLTSAALYFLERALREGSTRWMWRFAVALFLGILSSYATAFFCVAVGIYFLLHWRQAIKNRNMTLVWLGSQVAGLAMYAYLWNRAVAALRASHQVLVTDKYSWFLGMFPLPGDDPIRFALNGTLRQFDLTFTVDLIGRVAAALFVVGVGLLAYRSYRQRQWQPLSVIMLLVVPFAATCAGAFLRTYPYGKSRQTIFLAVFVAIGVAITLEWLTRRKLALAVLGSLCFIPLWYHLANYNPMTKQPTRDLGQLEAAISYLQQKAPPGSRVLAESDTRLLLEHYLREDEWPTRNTLGENHIGGYLMDGPAGSFQNYDRAWKHLRSWRERNNIDPDEMIWVVDSAGACDLCRELSRNPEIGKDLHELRQFSDDTLIFQVPASYNPEPQPEEAGQDTAANTAEGKQP